MSMNDLKLFERIKKSTIYARLSEIKNIKIIIAVVIIAIALLVYFISGMVGSEVKKEKDVESSTVSECEELESVLSRIKGAGRIKVLITYDGEGESVPAVSYDSTTVKTKDGDKVTEKTDTKSEPVMSKDSPVIIKKIAPTVVGVIIVAEGGGDSSVVVKLMNATKIALGIELDKIRVFEME